MVASLTVAQSALITVIKTTWAGYNVPTPDPNYANLYGQTRFMNTYPLGQFDGNVVALYRAGGTQLSQGVGTVKQYWDSRLRIDVRMRNFAEGEQACLALWQALEADYDYMPANAAGVVGQGYMKVKGLIKYMEIAPWQTVGDERISGSVFRRITDITVLLRD